MLKVKLNNHFKDVINLFAGTLLYAVSSVLSNIVLANNLDKSDFGRFNAINSTVVLISLFVLFGLNITSVRIISKFRKNNSNYTSSAIQRLKYFYKISLGVVLLIYGVSIPFFCNYFFSDQNLLVPFYFSLIYLFSFTYSELITGFLSGLGEFTQLRNLNYIKAFFAILIFAFTFISKNFLMFYAFFAFSNLLFIYISNSFLSKILVTNHSILEKKLPHRYNKKIMAYSSYIFLGGVVVLPFIYLSNIVLSASNGIQIFAITSIFATWQGVLTFFPITYSKVVLPYISGKKSNNSMSNNFDLVTRINNSAVYLIYLLLMFSSFFILNLYGHDYIEYLKLFNLFIGSTAIALLGNTYGTQVQVKGYRYTIVFGNLLVGVSILLSTALLSKHYGLLSLCIGMLIGNSISFLVSFFTILKKGKFHNGIHLYMISTYLTMLFLVLINYLFNILFVPIAIISILLLYFIDKKFRKSSF